MQYPVIGIDGFTTLPTGWYNYYTGIDGEMRKDSCPGVVKVEMGFPAGNEGSFFEFAAAAFDENGVLGRADDAPGYMFTSRVEDWPEDSDERGV